MNYIDLIFLLIVISLSYLGFRRGLIREGADVLVLIFSFIGAATTYQILSKVLTGLVSAPESYIKACSFFVSLFIFEMIFFLVARFALHRVDEDIIESPWNLWGGLALGFVKSMIFGFFIIAFIAMPPISTVTNDSISGSFVGTKLSKSTGTLEKYFRDILGEVVTSLSVFSTVTSGSNEKIDLGFTVAKPGIDKSSASEMYRSMNAERKKAGLKELKLDEKLSAVAEAYGKEMFASGYLSHIDLDGKTPFDRMKDAGISFFYAGENLAIAPNTDSAMSGLMQSPGHKANILSGNYGKIGIAVLDGGENGKIFAQEFTD